MYSKEYYENNKIKIKELAKKYYENNKIKIKEKRKKYRENNRDKILSSKKEYRENNKNKIKESAKEYYKNNKSKILNNHKEYYSNHKSEILEYLIEYQKNRKTIDPIFKFRIVISKQITKALKRNYCNKQKSIWSYLDYNKEGLINHLESKFEPWMNWNNHGVYNSNTWNDSDDSTKKWNIDHIIPQSSLPYTSIEDNNFKLCWALSNLRPLSAKQNIIDGARK